MCAGGGRAGRCAEDPLRTVELIKRPLELRDPATKLLYMASMGLYPMSGNSFLFRKSTFSKSDDDLEKVAVRGVRSSSK